MPMMKMEKGTKKCTNKSVKSYDQKWQIYGLDW
jgi:hypothetical protein